MDEQSLALNFTLAQQCHENDIAEVVLVHEPGIEALFGSLHASGSLFEKPVNLNKARENHKMFRDVLKRRNITVLTVRDVLEMHCERNFKYRVELEDLALDGLRYQLETMENDFELTQQQIHLLSNTYKRECLQSLSTNDLIDIIMMGPTVRLIPESINNPLRLEKLSMKPLLNLTFTRDQQIVTNRGLVIANMGSLQRKRETQIMKYCFKKLGLQVLGEIESPGLLEGGDFIAAGADLCFIGVGLRTNEFATNQMLNNDWFGTRRVAVVRDIFDCDQQRMHLDTVFNVASHNVCVMLETLIGDNSPERRLVTEYTRGTDNKYYVSRTDIELARYVKEEGYQIVPVTVEQQGNYGINFLNVGESTIVAVDESTARTLLSSGVFDGNIDLIDYSGMTTMYGSVHCCSQVLKRRNALVNAKFHEVKPVANISSDFAHKKGCVLVGPSYVLSANRVERKTEELTARTPDTQNIFANSSVLTRIRRNFSKLHQMLVENGISTNVVAHYPHEKTPWGIFASHSVVTGLDEGALFTPLDEKRLPERKDRLVSLFSSIDNGKSKILESSTKCYGAASLVVDKSNKKIYWASEPNELLHDRDIHFFSVTKQPSQTFNAVLDQYYTNSVLFIAEKFFVICSELISGDSVKKELENTGRTCIEVTEQQRNNFAVNGLIELQNGEGQTILFASRNAWKELHNHQDTLNKLYPQRIIVADVNEIEAQLGGSLNDLVSPL